MRNAPAIPPLPAGTVTFDVTGMEDHHSDGVCGKAAFHIDLTDDSVVTCSPMASSTFNSTTAMTMHRIPTASGTAALTFA